MPMFMEGTLCGCTMMSCVQLRRSKHGAMMRVSGEDERKKGEEWLGL